MARMKYFPHLAGSLIIASAALVGGNGLLDRWEPAKGKPDAHLYVYADKIANGLPTVCNGITKHVATIPVIVGEKWTQEMCNQQEEQALEALQTKLASCFKIKPPQSVFDSSTSHGWNFGVNKTCGSAAMLQFNLGNYKLGCQLIAFQYDGTTPNWSYVDGKFYQGLHNRRLDEKNVCLKDVK